MGSKHIEKISTSLAFRDMKNESYNVISYHIPIRMAKIKINKLTVTNVIEGTDN